ncbi:SPOR domain-containing protein [Suttonella sp. R2A3]|uniref:SPOR domain-containing protein n=1 Tax=Suttonella sp. R2A3 TaxID=2908648 RepID=UPI001F48D014|nr:SPOR domain-containing protein [Suttonella sp. R2A3]UJF23651.1 SPOR domain-containing protein [Suttonella sp. R2A3]
MVWQLLALMPWSGCESGKKKKTGGMNQLGARIIGMILMAFIVVVLVLIVYRFIQAMDGEPKPNRPATPPTTRQQPPPEQPKNTDQNNDARYDFYQELAHRRAEVDAEIERKTEETNVITDMEGNYFRVQVGAFREKEQADRMRARMILRDYPVTIVQSGQFYLVQVGPYQEKAYAQTIQKRLQRQGVDTLLKAYVKSQ